MLRFRFDGFALLIQPFQANLSYFCSRHVSIRLRLLQSVVSLDDLQSNQKDRSFSAPAAGRCSGTWRESSLLGQLGGAYGLQETDRIEESLLFFSFWLDKVEFRNCAGFRN